MHDKSKLLLALLASVLLLAGSVNAVRLAVVIEFPEGGVYKKCITVEENANAYDILKKTSLDMGWSAPGPWGHGLCAINGTGCPAENCFCSAEKYWNFYVKGMGKDTWEYSQKGFDGGTSCAEHYCAKEGEMLGFAYGAYGSTPGTYPFKDICPSAKTQEKNDYKVTVSPKQPSADEDITVLIADEETSDGIKGAEVSVYVGEKKIVSGKTDAKGEYSFRVDKAGRYTINTNVKGYDRPQRRTEIEVGSRLQQTTTSTSTTTTKQVTTTEETTTAEETTTTTRRPTTTSTTTTTTSSTTSTSTTSTSTTSTTTPAKPPDIIGNVVRYSAENSLLLSALIILILAAYTVNAAYRRGKQP